MNWGEASFERLVDAEPEPLVPQLQLTAAMLINVIARGGDVFGNVRSLVFDNHEPRARQYELARRALGIFRTLVAAQVVVHDVAGGGIRLTVDLQPNFALNQPLSPFALAAIGLLDPGDAPDAAGTGHYALDVVSVIEATLDDPRPVLSQQQFLARGEAVAAMKRDGLEYEERMEALEEITYPKPLEELLAQSFEVFASSQPWVRDFELSPKSVVRDMFERALSFGELISFYQLARSEGLVLRYLSDAYRAIRQTVPVEAQTPDLLDLVAWLGELVRQVDSSLVDEWESLVNPSVDPSEPVVPPAPPSVLTNRRAFLVLVRNELFRRVRLAALQKDDELAALDPDVDWSAALDAYFDEHDEMLTGGPARSPRLVEIDESDAAASGTLEGRADHRRSGRSPRLAHPRRGGPRRLGGGRHRGRAHHRGAAAVARISTDAHRQSLSAMANPPSELSTCPTIHAPSSVASHPMRFAGSLGRPKRPNGVLRTNSSISASGLSVVSGSRYPVFTGPGSIVFRMMPRSSSSAATVFVTPASAALLVA